MKTENPRILEQNIGGADISYLLWEGDGPCIIFLHATGFLPWIWHPIARELSSSFRIVAPYFCDHRHEDPDKGGLHWMVLAEDLCSFCEKLGLEKPRLVGHSMGATVMTLAEAVYGPKADRMLLIEPIFLPREFYRIQLKVEDHPLASKSIRRRNRWENREEAAAYLRSRPLFKKWDDEMLDLYIRYGMTEGETGGLTLACSPQREASLFMGGMHYDPWPLLPEVSCPVLLLEGEESENRPFIDLKKASALFPKGDHRLVREAGHLIPMEKPGEITGIIREYFS